MTSRRSFLASVLALGAAPAIVRAQSLMPVRVLTLPTSAYLTLVGDGRHDDTAALNALIAGSAVLFNGTEWVKRGGVVRFPQGTFRVTDSVRPVSNTRIFGNDTIIFVDAPGKPLVHIQEGVTNTVVANLHFTGHGAVGLHVDRGMI